MAQLGQAVNSQDGLQVQGSKAATTVTALVRRLAADHTVILIEHHLDVIKTADHVIDLGPEGGHAGGRVVVAGTPEQLAKSKESHTASFLAEILG